MGDEAPPLSLTLGASIDRYEIHKHLGTGAMGTVYLAKDTTLDRDVAIKLLRADMMDRKDLLSRFKREAKAVARINHPNVVQIFDTGQHDENHYFVMEYLEGVDGGELVRDYGPLPEPVVAAIGRDAALGLAEAGRADVIHRDVKPANLVITERGPIKVTDFGLAKACEPASTTGKLTLAGATLGTPDYMSPEQAIGAELEASSDVYSLGATLFHLLAGRPPFRDFEEDVGHMEVVARHVTHDVPRLSEVRPGIDGDLAELILRMMAKEPQFRPSYDEVISALEGFAEPLEGTVLERLRQRTTISHATIESPTAPPDGPDTISEGSTLLAGPRDQDPAPPTRRHAQGSSTTLEIPRLVPRWALVMTGLSIVIFGTSLLGYLVFQPGIELHLLGGAHSSLPHVAGLRDAGVDRGPPTGFAALTLPDGRRLLVSKRVVTATQAHQAGLRGSHAAGPARGYSLAEARRAVSTRGYRLPTGAEWPHLVAEERIALVPGSCEWVDDRTKQPSKKQPSKKTQRRRRARKVKRSRSRARCFRRLEAVRRVTTRRYKDTVFRLVRSLRHVQAGPEPTNPTD